MRPFIEEFGFILSKSAEKRCSSGWKLSKAEGKNSHFVKGLLL
jgi:hypothetical protein